MSRKILIADDESDIVAMLGSFFESRGFCVLRASNGAEALRQAEQWGVHPTGILKTAERTHIFTHVQWDLRGVWLTCAAEAPRFTWADENALRHKIGLPTAYRQFLDLHAE